MTSSDKAPTSACAPLNPAADGRLVLAAAMLMALVLGSIHAFSVFPEPMELLFKAPRATVSLTYSFALVSLTAAVLIGHHVYARLAPPLVAQHFPQPSRHTMARSPASASVAGCSPPGAQPV